MEPLISAKMLFDVELYQMSPLTRVEGSDETDPTFMPALVLFGPNVCFPVQVFTLAKFNDAMTCPVVGDIVRVPSLFCTLNTDPPPPPWQTKAGQH